MGVVEWEERKLVLIRPAQSQDSNSPSVDIVLLLERVVLVALLFVYTWLIWNMRGACT